MASFVQLILMSSVEMNYSRIHNILFRSTYLHSIFVAHQGLRARQIIQKCIACHWPTFHCRWSGWFCLWFLKTSWGDLQAEVGSRWTDGRMDECGGFGLVRELAAISTDCSLTSWSQSHWVMGSCPPFSLWVSGGCGPGGFHSTPFSMRDSVTNRCSPFNSAFIWIDLTLSRVSKYAVMWATGEQRLLGSAQ